MTQVTLKLEELKDYLAKRTGSKLTRHFDKAVRAMLLTELDEYNHDEWFRGYLEIRFGTHVRVAHEDYHIATALKALEPEKYNDLFGKFLDTYTIACGHSFFYEDQLKEQLEFFKSIGDDDTVYEILFPNEAAV